MQEDLARDFSVCIAEEDFAVDAAGTQESESGELEVITTSLPSTEAGPSRTLRRPLRVTPTVTVLLTFVGSLYDLTTSLRGSRSMPLESMSSSSTMQRLGSVSKSLPSPTSFNAPSLMLIM